MSVGQARSLQYLLPQQISLLPEPPFSLTDDVFPRDSFSSFPRLNFLGAIALPATTLASQPFIVDAADKLEKVRCHPFPYNISDSMCGADLRATKKCRTFTTGCAPLPFCCIDKFTMACYFDAFLVAWFRLVSFWNQAATREHMLLFDIFSLLLLFFLLFSFLYPFPNPHVLKHLSL